MKSWSEFYSAVVAHRPELVKPSWSPQLEELQEAEDRKLRKELPVSKIGGIHPFRFKGFEWPKCKKGHFMSFICQILVNDLHPEMQEKLAKDSWMIQSYFCMVCGGDNQSSFYVNAEESPDLDACYEDPKIRAGELKSKNKSDAEYLEPECFPTKIIKCWTDRVDNFPSQIELLEDESLLEKTGIDYEEFSEFYEENYDTYLNDTRTRLGGWVNWPQAPEYPGSEGDSEDATETLLQLGQSECSMFSFRYDTGFLNICPQSKSLAVGFTAV